MTQDGQWRHYPPALDADDPGDPLGPPILWPDGRYVAASGLGRIFLWESATGEGAQVRSTNAICRDGIPYFQLACEPGRGRVLTGHLVRDFASWDARTWQRQIVFSGHSEEVYAAAFVTPDRIVSVSGDSSARLRDASSGTCLQTLEAGPLYALADDPARGRLAVAGGGGNVWVLDRSNLRLISKLTVPLAKAQHQPLSEARKRQIGIVWNRPSNQICALAWHPDGEHLLCGSWDFVPKMIDVRTGHVVRSWHGHAHWVDHVAVDPARRRLLTGSSDGTIRVWSLDSSACLAVYELGAAKLGGFILHEHSLYVSCGYRLLVIPHPD